MINALLRYETQAEAFRLHTGMIAPGKDSCDGAFTQEEREEAWNNFKKEYLIAFDLFFVAAGSVLFSEPNTKSSHGTAQP